MKTSKERIEEQRQRKVEYAKMRSVLLDIVDDDEASNTDKIAAVNMIYRIDNGVPLPENH